MRSCLPRLVTGPWHSAVAFVPGGLKWAGEREQSVLRQVDEEPQASGVWPFLQSRSGFTKLPGWQS